MKSSGKNIELASFDSIFSTEETRQGSNQRIQQLSLSELAAPVKLYPQYTLNIRVKDKGAVLSDADVLGAKDEVEKLINGKGRVLLRKSGTEPVIRIMTECETEEKCREYADIIAKKVKEKGHTI